MGAAAIWVTNVAPYWGGVTFMLHVDWKSALNVAVTIRVEEELPVFWRAF